MNQSMQILSTFEGIDVSKRKLDIAVLLNGKIKSKVVNNEPSGFAQLDEWLRERNISHTNAHLCLEATGPYSEQVALALVSNGRLHRRITTSAAVRQLGQGAHHDFQNGSCRFAESLVYARHGSVTSQHSIKAFGERMKANGLMPKAVIGAAMGKLVHLIYGVVKSGKPFDANFANKGLAIQDGI